MAFGIVICSFTAFVRRELYQGWYEMGTWRMTPFAHAFEGFMTLLFDIHYARDEALYEVCMA